MSFHKKETEKIELVTGPAGGQPSSPSTCWSTTKSTHNPEANIWDGGSPLTRSTVRGTFPQRVSRLWAGKPSRTCTGMAPKRLHYDFERLLGFLIVVTIIVDP